MVLMKPDDPIRAKPVTLEEGMPAFRVSGHPDAIKRFLDGLDGTLTDHDPALRSLDLPHDPGAWFVWPVYSSASRADLAEELRKASDIGRVDLIIEPEAP